MTWRIRNRKLEAWRDCQRLERVARFEKPVAVLGLCPRRSKRMALLRAAQVIRFESIYF